MRLSNRFESSASFFSRTPTFLNRHFGIEHDPDPVGRWGSAVRKPASVGPEGIGEHRRWNSQFRCP